MSVLTLAGFLLLITIILCAASRWPLATAVTWSAALLWAVSSFIASSHPLLSSRRVAPPPSWHPADEPSTSSRQGSNDDEAAPSSSTPLFVVDGGGVDISWVTTHSLAMQWNGGFRRRRSAANGDQSGDALFVLCVLADALVPPGVLPRHSDAVERPTDQEPARPCQLEMDVDVAIATLIRCGVCPLKSVAGAIPPLFFRDAEGSSDSPLHAARCSRSVTVVSTDLRRSCHVAVQDYWQRGPAQGGHWGLSPPQPALFRGPLVEQSLDHYVVASYLGCHRDSLVDQRGSRTAAATAALPSWGCEAQRRTLRDPPRLHTSVPPFANDDDWLSPSPSSTSGSNGDRSGGGDSLHDGAHDDGGYVVALPMRAFVRSSLFSETTVGRNEHDDGGSGMGFDAPTPPRGSWIGTRRLCRFPAATSRLARLTTLVRRIVDHWLRWPERWSRGVGRYFTLLRLGMSWRLPEDYQCPDVRRVSYNVRFSE